MMMHHWDWATAERELERAIELIKGQFPLAVVALMVIAAMYKMPAEVRLLVAYPCLARSRRIVSLAPPWLGHQCSINSPPRADARSEFSKRIPVLSEGRILIEATWASQTSGRAPTSLTLALIQPDGTTVATKSVRVCCGSSIVRDIERFRKTNGTKWTVKILNDVGATRSEVSGTLSVTIPTTRALEDTQFMLLGSGNAQEIPFIVPAPGRVEVDVSWQADVLATVSNVTLIVR
jgi:hypothetical protein